MASIFTFDPDPPRVSSPWSNPPQGALSGGRRQAGNHSSQFGGATSNNAVIDYNAITRLEAEPQEGPTEYKLHLLLRRRRSFVRTSTSTGRHVPGSYRRSEASTTSSVGRSASDASLLASTPPPLSSTQSRQHRLEQLTTQLLWRLQQSCPYHVSSSAPAIIPHFPDEAQLSDPTIPQRLLPGLEESKGALYEIGVADDGTFVGLAEDEMEESLDTLRAMAVSLGCCVDVLHKVEVGQCEWLEEDQLVTSKLWVAEAYVRPDQHLIGVVGNIPANELRVSLTGATMSGKSTLLGTLTTATKDDGRGKSRLNLLKHRHEVQSGMTSSITQELIGYRDVLDQDGTKSETLVINYADRNISSWVDIHGSAEGGRLVFLSDSAGHPRFRRTTVRGVVGWDPHWTLLCIPADNTEDSAGKVGASPTSQEILGPAAADVDLSRDHLQLCLNLELPFVIIITKYDLATKPGLRRTLSKVLSAIKEAGRKPVPFLTIPHEVSETELNVVTADELIEVASIIEKLKTSPLAVVPIILTSSYSGTGITKLHALLRELPLPSTPKPPADVPRTLFHIEDVYSNVSIPSRDVSHVHSSSDNSVIIGGHLRYGTIRVGDELLIGPYPVDVGSDDSDSGSGRGSSPSNRSIQGSPVPTSRSFPGAYRKGRSALRSSSSVNEAQYEWRGVRITSIRNLRLPVRSLQAGQVGTIGVAPIHAPIASPAIVRIRKGMVLADDEPTANRVIVVRFKGSAAQAIKSLTVGSAVVLYVASVRASAKVVSTATAPYVIENEGRSGDAGSAEEDNAFGLGGFDDQDEYTDKADKTTTMSGTMVTFQFIASREFVELDSRVLILPGGGPGLYGGTERGERGVAALEGFVGYVVEGR
jgi:GTPase